jgi:fumarylacetoacetase
MNETHNPALRSWIASANQPGADFPVQNLPYCVFRSPRNAAPRIGVAIGDCILDCHCLPAGEDPLRAALRAPSLNALLALGPAAWRDARARLSALLREDSPERPENFLTPIREARLELPSVIGDYTDFYCSIFHATNVGAMFRPDAPLLPNYKWLPVGYHGRASSVIPSGVPVRRPCGQTEQNGMVSFGPTRMLDYELELGFFVGPGNALGEPVPIARAPEHIFGFCLLNDWSARDIQRWEYQPLGPFLAKSFATSISPFVVTAEALAPFRCARFSRNAGDPAPLPHLDDPADARAGGIDATLEVWLRSARMAEPVLLSRGNARDLYWTAAQMLAHHTSNGCNLRPGDLIASGTVSGREKSSRGCLLELTWRGAEPVSLPSQETRTFLEDGDEVILRGYCEREGARRIGFGECRAVILPAGE